jgi:type IV pilus assembly protein PilX
MKSLDKQVRQHGIALVVSLLFLLVVTIISITAARNSTISLRMASNMQDQNNSLQSSEAGLFGALALATTVDSPFPAAAIATASINPFSASVNPLDNLNEQGSVTARVRRTAVERECPRPRAGRGGYSAGVESPIACDFYRIDSEHDVTGRARTKASLGVVKMVLK